MIDRRAGATITAIVRSTDGIRFVTTDARPQAVMSRLADYVRERCDDVLWADAASQVRAMLDVGNLYAAITLYFERVGERWDDERLELVTLERGHSASRSRGKRMANAR